MRMTETLSFLYKSLNWIGHKIYEKTAISLLKFRVWSTQNL